MEVLYRCLQLAGDGVFCEFENVVKSCALGRNEFWRADGVDVCPQLSEFRSLVRIVVDSIGIGCDDVADEANVARVGMRIGWLREFAEEVKELDGVSHRIINPFGHLSKRLRWLGHDVIDFPRIGGDVDEFFNSRLVVGLLESGWCTAVVGHCYDGTGVNKFHQLLANAVVAGDIVRFGDVYSVPFCWSHFMEMFDVEDLPESIVSVDGFNADE